MNQFIYHGGCDLADWCSFFSPVAYSLPAAAAAAIHIILIKRE